MKVGDLVFLFSQNKHNKLDQIVGIIIKKRTYKDPHSRYCDIFWLDDGARINYTESEAKIYRNFFINWKRRNL